MTIKFQADNDLNQIIVSAIKRREAEVDFQTAHAADLHGLSDPEVLALAARDGRILVTHDLKTIPTISLCSLRSKPVQESSWCPNVCLLGKSLATLL